MIALAGAGLAQGPPAKLAVHILAACGPGAGQRVRVADSPAPLCLQGPPFLTAEDVQSAEVHRNSKGRRMLFLTFHDDAAIRELQITKKNIGNRVAILLNGKVVGTPLISAASRLLYIESDFTPEQAESLAAAFNRKAQARRGK